MYSNFHISFYSYMPSNIQLLCTRRRIAYSVLASHDFERRSVCCTMRSMSLFVKAVHIWNSLWWFKTLIMLLHLSVNAIIFYSNLFVDHQQIQLCHWENVIMLLMLTYVILNFWIYIPLHYIICCNHYLNICSGKLTQVFDFKFTTFKHRT